jgi:hypothetical protein
MLIGMFSDAFIYESSFRFTIPGPYESVEEVDLDSVTPALARALKERDPTAVAPVVISDRDRASLKRIYADSSYESFIGSCLSNFEGWVKSYRNREKLKQWLTTQSSPQVRSLWRAQVHRDYFFDLDRGGLVSELQGASKRLGIGMGDLCTAFDSVLRVPLYADKTGAGNYYIFHPQREAWRLTAEQEITPGPEFPISFSFAFGNIAPYRTRDQFADLLCEARQVVREWRVIESPPDAHRMSEALRDLAARLELPARLRGLGRVADALSAVSGLVGGGAPQALRLLTSVVAFDSLSVPGVISRCKMMHPILAWDLENQEAGKRGGTRPGKVMRQKE